MRVVNSVDQNNKLSPVRVAFVHAPDSFYSEMQNNGVLFMPVWAYTLASHVPDNGKYLFDLFDTRFQVPSEFSKADIYLYSGINQDYSSLVEVRDTMAKRFPRARHILGGPICWSYDQAGDIQKLQMFDHLVIGDGEDVISDLLDQIVANQNIDHILRSEKRFDVSLARPFYRPLLDKTIGRYYGAVLEISRGCPFLCEFCDIRVLPDNNRPRNKTAALIVEELNYLSRAGVSHFLLACDNFIGDPRWAEQVVDAILQWQEETGFRPSMYTWLTINLYKFPELMKKMRQAGFDMLFIGVESFNSNSLLETAKVQNTAAGLVESIKEIQSYGFFIVGGLIFGFDSDGEDCFDITSTGILESGLLSGDPSLLTALPGTPLYRRMKLAGRLRDVRYGLGGYKYQTNIKYLLPHDAMIKGFQKFVLKLTSGSYQYARLKAYFDNLHRGNFIPLPGKGYANPRDALKTVSTNRRSVMQAVTRVMRFLSVPSNLFWFARAILKVAGHRSIQGRYSYLMFWWVLWSTVIVKYRGISESDFDVESVGEEFDIANVLPNGYSESEAADIPVAKIKAQQRFTTKALEQLSIGAPQ